MDFSGVLCFFYGFFYGGFLCFSYIFLICCFLWLAKKKADTSDVSAMFHGSMRFESKAFYDVFLVDFFVVFGACRWIDVLSLRLG